MTERHFKEHKDSKGLPRPLSPVPKIIKLPCLKYNCRVTSKLRLALKFSVRASNTKLQGSRSSRYRNQTVTSVIQMPLLSTNWDSVLLRHALSVQLVGIKYQLEISLFPTHQHTGEVVQWSLVFLSQDPGKSYTNEENTT